MLAFVAAWCTEHLSAVKRYQLWQVKDSHVKQERNERVCAHVLRCARSLACAHVYGSDRVRALLCCEIS